MQILCNVPPSVAQHPSITQWKMDMMAELLLQSVWQSKRKELLETLDGICDYYKATSKQNCSESVIFIESQIEKVEQRKKSLITMFADGNLTQDEYTVMKAEYNEEIKKAQRTERTSERAREYYEWLHLGNICGCETAWQNA